jgi:hypothetical protein
MGWDNRARQTVLPPQVCVRVACLKKLVTRSSKISKAPLQIAKGSFHALWQKGKKKTSGCVGGRVLFVGLSPSNSAAYVQAG